MGGGRKEMASSGVAVFALREGVGNKAENTEYSVLFFWDCSDRVARVQKRLVDVTKPVTGGGGNHGSPAGEIAGLLWVGEVLD